MHASHTVLVMWGIVLSAFGVVVTVVGSSDLSRELARQSELRGWKSVPFCEHLPECHGFVVLPEASEEDVLRACARVRCRRACLLSTGPGPKAVAFARAAAQQKRTVGLGLLRGLLVRHVPLARAALARNMLDWIGRDPDPFELLDAYAHLFRETHTLPRPRCD